jgi:hypothetical protein
LPPQTTSPAPIPKAPVKKQSPQKPNKSPRKAPTPKPKAPATSSPLIELPPNPAESLEKLSISVDPDKHAPTIEERSTTPLSAQIDDQIEAALNSSSSSGSESSSSSSSSGSDSSSSDSEDSFGDLENEMNAAVAEGDGAAAPTSHPTPSMFSDESKTPQVVNLYILAYFAYLTGPVIF